MGIVIKILEVLIPILIGFAFRLSGLFGDREGEVLRRFCIRFTLPIFVFFSFYGAEAASFSALPPMVASLLLLSVVLFVLGWVGARFVEGAGRKSAVHVCIMFGNYGWMGYGVAQTLLGQEGFLRAIFFTLLWWPVFYGFGLAAGLCHTEGRKGSVPLERVLKVALPLMGCFGLGLVFNVFGWQVPDLLVNTLRPFGNMTIPLLLFSVGVLLDLSKVRQNIVPALVVSGLTLCVAPLIGWGLAAALTSEPVTFRAVVLEAAMPVATVTPVLAENFELDLKLVSTAIAASTVLSFITLPVVAFLVL